MDQQNYKVLYTILWKNYVKSRATKSYYFKLLFVLHFQPGWYHPSCLTEVDRSRGYADVPHRAFCRGEVRKVQLEFRFCSSRGRVCACYASGKNHELLLVKLDISFCVFNSLLVSFFDTVYYDKVSSLQEKDALKDNCFSIRFNPWVYI